MGRLLKWSGKENVNLYLYVIPISSLLVHQHRAHILLQKPSVIFTYIHPMWNAYFCILPKIHQIQLSKIVLNYVYIISKIILKVNDVFKKYHDHFVLGVCIHLYTYLLIQIFRDQYEKLFFEFISRGT